jgi:hypothetical protein
MSIGPTRDMSVVNEISAALSVLVGQPFWRTSRASSLQCFHFGERTTRIDRNGELVEVGRYALHVECAWRLRLDATILVASRDRYDVIDGGDSWDRIGANLLDHRMAEVIAQRCPVAVTRVSTTSLGDVTIEMDAGLALEIWIDDSSSDELWRLLSPGKSEPHVVFTAGQLRVD